LIKEIELIKEKEQDISVSETVSGTPRADEHNKKEKYIAVKFEIKIIT